MGYKQFWSITWQITLLLSWQLIHAQNHEQERLPIMVHILSDCSGRLYLPKDTIVPPRDLEIIETLVRATVCSKKGYGLNENSFIEYPNKKLNLELKEEVKFYTAGSRYFPVVKFSTLRTGGTSVVLEPPIKNYLRLSYRANYKRVNEPTIGEHLENLNVSIVRSYEEEIDKFGLNVLAELEFYISQALEETSFKHVFIVFTDGFVNSSNQLIWSPIKIRKAVSYRSLISELYQEPSNLDGRDSKLILLETGGYDYNPRIGRTGEFSQNDVLKELWQHWSDKGNLQMVWRTKWDRELTAKEMEELLFEP